MHNCERCDELEAENERLLLSIAYFQKCSEGVGRVAGKLRARLFLLKKRFGIDESSE